MERKEDILTSNVFSFFKYSNREIFLKGYLRELGIAVSDEEVRQADFKFWPRYEENTEPDLVVLVGDYYLLFEAKYYSGFGKETEKTKAQLIREFEGGTADAKNMGKKFKLITITKDHIKKGEHFKDIPSKYAKRIKWTNWQKISAFLAKVLESDIKLKNQERIFAEDLGKLLDKKNLRDFQGLEFLGIRKMGLKSHPKIFFMGETAKFRGDFLGFVNTLGLEPKMVESKGCIFWSTEQEMFTSLKQDKALKVTNSPVFYQGGKSK
ncbi:hypothetical protein ACFL4N_04095 [Thermodesulfobacteriota bacterium]